LNLLWSSGGKEELKKKKDERGDYRKEHRKLLRPSQKTTGNIMKVQQGRVGRKTRKAPAAEKKKARGKGERELTKAFPN